MKPFFLFLFALSSTFANQTKFHAKDVNYRDKKLSLNGDILFTHENGLTLSCEGKVEFDQKPMKITASDHLHPIKISNNRFEGEAEEVSFSQESHAIVFKKLLNFTDKENHLKLSADQLEIKGNEFKGVGKVHIEFDESEQHNLIQMLEECTKNLF